MTNEAASVDPEQPPVVQLRLQLSLVGCKPSGAAD
jgi:hypothetical protein